MRTRHRIPMIFSLSMMDVFCCTLGCVILLWLINQREAMLRTRAASQVREKLTVSEQQRGQLNALLDDLDRQLAAAKADLKTRMQGSSMLLADGATNCPSNWRQSGNRPPMPRIGSPKKPTTRSRWFVSATMPRNGPRTWNDCCEIKNSKTKTPPAKWPS